MKRRVHLITGGEVRARVTSGSERRTKPGDDIRDLTPEWERARRPSTKPRTKPGAIDTPKASPAKSKPTKLQERKASDVKVCSVCQGRSTSVARYYGHLVCRRCRDLEDAVRSAEQAFDHWNRTSDRGGSTRASGQAVGKGCESPGRTATYARGLGTSTPHRKVLSDVSCRLACERRLRRLRSADRGLRRVADGSRVSAHSALGPAEGDGSARVLGRVLEGAGLSPEDVVVVRHTYKKDGLRNPDGVTPELVRTYTRPAGEAAWQVNCRSTQLVGGVPGRASPQVSPLHGVRERR